MKRLAIYFFYNAEGWVGDYVPFYLSKLREYCEEICVIVNAPLTAEGRRKLNKVCDLLLVRENKGFDSWAYKYAIEYYGYEKIKEYDELILNNFTFYGPIYPLKELFDEMDNRDCDFWGINRHPKQEIYLIQDEDSLVYEHIQSYFIVFRKQIIKDISFKEYWDSLKPVHNYDEARIYHEFRCSRYFEARGFASSTYMDFTYFKNYLCNASVLVGDKQHITYRNPFVKRKIFYLENIQWICQSIGHSARDLLDFITTQTDYDEKLIWQDLIKTQKLSVLRNNLHLSFILPKNRSYYLPDSKRIALIFFVYYDDLVDQCISYINNMPQGCTIAIISSKKELLANYKEKLCSKDYHCEYIECENRGRDVSAYLIAGKEIFCRFKYVCCLHDKKSLQLKNKLMGEEFFYHCLENNAASRDYVNSIIELFEKNSQLGMLIPPTVAFGKYYQTLGNEMGLNEVTMQDCYERLNLLIPFDDVPVAPFGTMFWVRSKAFKSVFNYPWKYRDFPEEPNANDGSILHGIERVYAMAVQNEGYYTAWVSTDSYAAAYTDNAIYELQTINKILRKKNIRYFFEIIKKLPTVLVCNEKLVIPPFFETVKASKNIIRKIAKIQFFRYRILAEITFGKTRKRYKEKKKQCKELITYLQER